MITTKKLPLLSYDGTDWEAQTNLYELESYIAGNHALACHSCQIAIQIVLEGLGTRTQPVPVAMPVTAPPDTIAAVLRAGATPLLTDIDEGTLQMKPEHLRMIIEDLGTVIVLLTRPGGQYVDKQLLDLVKDLPTVIDSRLVPHPQLTADDLVGSFNVFDLTSVLGSGGVIIHKFPKQVHQLRTIRSGLIGNAAALSEPAAEKALQSLIGYNNNGHRRVATKYHECFKPLQKRGILPMEPSLWPSPLYVSVPNAKVTVAHLHTYGIEAALAVYPLYNLEEIRRRYTQDPEYPVAERLQQTFICLPTHRVVEGREAEIVKRIEEVL